MRITSVLGAARSPHPLKLKNIMFWKKDHNLNLRAMYHRQGAFNSKAGAFDYFFFIEGKEAEEAERLATTVANCRGVPDIAPPAPTLVDKVKDLLKQGSELANENPRVAELLIGLVSGAAASLTGVAVGSNLSNSETTSAPKYEIDSNVEPKEIE